jgi:hypothetical protein
MAMVSLGCGPKDASRADSVPDYATIYLLGMRELFPQNCVATFTVRSTTSSCAAGAHDAHDGREDRGGDDDDAMTPGRNADRQVRS